MGQQAISTDLDPNTHGAGFLQALIQNKVFIENFRVCVRGDIATEDSNCDDDHPPIHCTPNAIQGSSKVFILNIGVHRDDDKRACGAKTIASVTKVFAG